MAAMGMASPKGGCSSVTYTSESSAVRNSSFRRMRSQSISILWVHAKTKKGEGHRPCGCTPKPRKEKDIAPVDEEIKAFLTSRRRISSNNTSGIPGVNYTR